jgi:hypothetical protein
MVHWFCADLVSGVSHADCFNVSVTTQHPDAAAPARPFVIEPPTDGRREYRVGDTARVEVVGTRILKSGLVVLEVKPAPKPPKA